MQAVRKIVGWRCVLSPFHNCSQAYTEPCGGGQADLYCHSRNNSIPSDPDGFLIATNKVIVILHKKWNKMKRSLLLLLAVMTACAVTEDRDYKQAASHINAEKMAEYIEVMASDEFMGRMPFTRGEELTIQFLKEAYMELGLEPAWHGSYFQEVPLMQVAVRPDAQMLFATTAGPLALDYIRDFVSFSPRVEDVALVEDAGLVFAGYGIVAPEYGWNDYEGLDVSDKIVVVIVNDPGFATGDPDLFNGNAMTYYGRWTYKFEEAARQGALGLIIVHDTPGAGYPWSVVTNGAQIPKMYLEDENGYAGHARIEGWITTEAAIGLFGSAGLDFLQLKESAAQRDFQSIHLPVRLQNFKMQKTFHYNVSFNVLGLLPGTDLADEVIIYSSHWDHLGIGPPLNGDSIYNGAVDNGTTTAWMLEIARAFTKLEQRPRRSILFFSPTAEEQGLLGAHYYAANPAFPLHKTVANLNNDLMLPLGRMKDVMITGYGQSELDDLVYEAAALQDRYVVPDPNPQTGMYYRADHFAFAKVGVPALFARGNTHHREHGLEWTAEQERLWLENNYHKPTDRYEPEWWDLEGIVEDARLAFYIGWKLAGSDRFPQWKEGSEFKAIREAMMD
jgi:Zn-dependent M28 family amino/carboxypeptidase